MSGAVESPRSRATPRRCSACAREQPRTARFCGSCGAVVPDEVAQPRGDALDERRVVFALCTVVAGTFAALLIASFASERIDWLGDSWLTPLLVALVSFAAARTLGPAGPRRSLGGRASPRAIAIGVAAGAVTFGVAWLIVAGMSALVGPGPLDDAPPRFAWIGVVFLAPLAEEWLCRGVVWICAESIVSTSATIALSAAIFAVLHGLNGGAWSEIPHRFAVGVVFGVLRARTGSLSPSIAAHMTHNALASGAGG